MASVLSKSMLEILLREAWGDLGATLHSAPFALASRARDLNWGSQLKRDACLNREFNLTFTSDRGSDRPGGSSRAGPDQSAGSTSDCSSDRRAATRTTAAPEPVALFMTAAFPQGTG